MPIFECLYALFFNELLITLRLACCLYNVHVHVHVGNHINVNKHVLLPVGNTRNHVLTLSWQSEVGNAIKKCAVRKKLVKSTVSF